VCKDDNLALENYRRKFPKLNDETKNSDLYFLGNIIYYLN